MKSNPIVNYVEDLENQNKCLYIYEGKNEMVGVCLTNNTTWSFSSKIYKGLSNSTDIMQRIIMV